jgi:hypothetical protein
LNSSRVLATGKAACLRRVRWLERSRAASSASMSVPSPDVDVSSITKSSGAVDAVTVALAQNGSQDGTVPPLVVSGVNLLVWKAQATTPVWVAKMAVTTSAPWTNGSFNVATASGLASLSPTAVSGDTLVLRVRYQGNSTFHDNDYLVP